MNHLKGLDLQEGAREEVPDVVVYLPCDPRALRERGRHRHLVARIDELAVLVTKQVDLLLEAVSEGMKTINQRDLRRRVLATPTSSSSRGMQLLCACAITGLVSWAWVCVGGLVIFGQSSLVSSPVQVLIMAYQAATCKKIKK